jgi:hypothetical protein
MRHVDHHRHDLERRLIEAEGALDLDDDVGGFSGEITGRDGHAGQLKHTLPGG